MATSALMQFQLTGVSDTGRTIGNGSYATVKELEFRGLKCVGKKIHKVLFDAATPQEKAAMLQRFTEECELLHHLYHPCVVQFLGIYFEHGSQLPVLVMEYLHSTLSACLERYGVLPEAISYGILRDVALSLRYLHEHSPPIIHRDLSANNVLLTSSMSGKISDLGVAKILNITPAQMTQRMSTQAPGTPCYMPPEALMARPTYTSKIDSYSYGVMIIHVFCGRWPLPTDAFRIDSKNPEALVPVSELDRRAEYLQDIGQTHPLMGLIRQCLCNIPRRRPEASEILCQLSAIMSRAPLTLQSKMEMQTQIESLTVQVEQLSTQNQDLTAQNQKLTSKIKSLTAKSQLSVRDSKQPQLPPKPLPKPRPRSLTQPELPVRESRAQSPPILLHPQAKLHWRKVANLPVGMARPQVVVVGETVCVGGGDTDSQGDYYLVFQYSPARDEWTTLPPCLLHEFGLGQLSGLLLTVGGVARKIISGKVYCYKPESRRWEEFLQPMPTPRRNLSVISTQSFLIACGGTISIGGGKYVPCTTVEIYSTQASQWYTANSLPVPCSRMSSATMVNTAYLLGGVTIDTYPTRTVLYTPIDVLIQKATSHQYSPQSAHAIQSESTWKTLRDTPLNHSAAASLGGMLLAVGGYDDQQETLPTVHVHCPATRSWIRVQPGDLPESQYMCSAVGLSANRLLIIGGLNDDVKTVSTVFLSSIIFEGTVRS